jgi:hypothetical protein
VKTPKPKKVRFGVKVNADVVKAVKNIIRKLGGRK